MYKKVSSLDEVAVGGECTAGYQADKEGKDYGLYLNANEI